MKNRVFAGRYRVTDKIGTGGMADVFKAYDEVLGRAVAVKVMLPQYAADPTFTARFRQEAQAAANLSSPYIVNIYDWGQDGNTYFIVMEYIHGIELKRAIRERGALPERKVAEIASQVCQALSVAHRYDIIHRDIKPQNIMVQPDGNAKVMDFGIARAGNSSLTTTNSVLGTAHYVSPEQAQGKKLTYASDLYSLGVVMYEAATGKLPFDAPDAVAVAMKQVSEEPVPPSQINPGISRSFENIILRAMSKNPADRYKSAIDMKNTINSYLAGVYIPAFGESTQQTHRQGATSQRGGTQVISSGGGSTRNTKSSTGNNNNNSSSNGSGNRRGDLSQAGNNPTRKRRKWPVVLAVIAVIAALGIIAAAVGFNNQGNTVPTVVGMSQADAQNTIENAGFTVGTVSEESSLTVQQGYVISQDPEGGERANLGSAVNIVVSSGEAQTARVTVPDLSELSADEAIQKLTAANLVPKEGKSEYSSNIEEGYVCSQDPDPGKEVDAGTTVTYHVSLGVEEVTVPEVTGMSKSNAVATLNNHGIEAAASEDYSNSVDKGYVISQDPDAGDTVPVGSTVNIVVSLGKEESEVPDVTGLSQSSAAEAASEAGFSLSVDGTTPTSDEDLDGVVASQTPVGGSSASDGSTISVRIYEYDEPISSSSDSSDDDDGDEPSSKSSSSSSSSYSSSSSSSSQD